MKFYRNKDIEQITSIRLAEYQDKYGDIGVPPVPIELIIENLFDLHIVWEEIGGIGTDSTFGALRKVNREILINEHKKHLFDEKPGLLRFTFGHELGHWDLFVDKSTLDHPRFEGFDIVPHFSYRDTIKGKIEIIKEIISNPEYRQKYLELQKHFDTPTVASAVNRYSSALLMPKALILKYCNSLDLKNWPNLYKMAEDFEVTISALTVRLQRLNMIYISNENTIHASREEYYGQTSLF
ncbi:hypothetical protein GF406_12055 [candidate division KSB1 bacterium]|nr:hypothetical protein [candidate division KSB1 bacterium]